MLFDLNFVTPVKGDTEMHCILIYRMPFAVSSCAGVTNFQNGLGFFGPICCSVCVSFVKIDVYS